MAALQYRPAIDGLRAIAVLAVCVFHLNHSWLPGGFVGVDVFFVISGYLITSIIVRDCEAGEFSLLKFYQRRIARILPAFLTVGLATLAGAFFIYTPQDLASAGALFAAAALCVANMKLMFQGTYFEISTDAQPFLHYWSLAVEEQFYILFPFLFLLLLSFAKNSKNLILGVLGLMSLGACITLTQFDPVCAFYLLHTRAWELLAGCLLAEAANEPGLKERINHVSSSVSSVGLAMVAASFILIHEGPDFPGFWALLPVAGTVAVIAPPMDASGISEKLLSFAPLVWIGRMSFSLYLWHWPIFSAVDYHFLLAPDSVRLGLKIGISLVTSYLGFSLIEKPARTFLNRRESRPIAYAVLAVGLVVCVPLGLAIRRANYPNPEVDDVATGGLLFPGKPGATSVVLMGDSYGAMYAKVTKEICAELGYNLSVISVAAADPLPSSNGKHSQLWLDSLAVVEKVRPDCLVVACRWESKLGGDKARLALALESLKPLAARIVILNQPPALPINSIRASLRQGARPPFFEEVSHKKSRADANEFLSTLSTPGQVSLIDIAQHFQGDQGEVRILDSEGRQLYQDRTHLSGYGAELIRPVLQAALAPRLR